MFGFSFTKILFTILAIAAAWYGFKWVGRMQEQREQRLAEAKRNPTKPDRDGRPAGPGKSAEPSSAPVEEMVKCPVCSDYVPQSAARNCGRVDCPYPG
ncbi:MAG: hypothetical protein ACPGOV_04835 [Magnetovibrionaceae bacterium]